jgi:Ca-activated chloride channel family protein
MRFSGFPLIVGSLILLVSAVFAQSPDLPAAPSATRQQNQQKQQAPTPQAKPAEPQTPAPANAEPAATATSENAQPAASGETPEAPSSKPAASPATRPAALAAGSSPDEEETTIRRTVNEVNVVFTVTDKHGHYVHDLKKNDFRVLDNNRPAAEIRSFHTEQDLPLQVGLLVDASNSIRDRFKFEQEAAIEFLNQTVRHGYDTAFVIGFDVTPEVTQDFTDDTEALSRGVRSLRAGGGTAMYDALYYACRDKLLKHPQTGPVRRALILLSDGDDNQSHVTREEAIEMAQRTEVIVYTISTNVTGSRQRGDKVLERIADATGGRAFFPFQINDVANAFVEIQDELRSQYLLSYKPADFRTDGSFHTIEILAQNHKGLRVRARRGYFAPTQQ